MALRRLTKELKEFEDNLSESKIFGGPIGDDVYHWKVTMIGLEGTPYKNGHYDLDIVFPNDYPFKPPKIKFLTKIYHCNINSKGGIDCSILGDNWSPALTTSKVLISLQSCMITGGNPRDPLIADIADEMTSNITKFLQIASDWNVKYASGDPAPNPITDTSFANFVPWVQRDEYKKIYTEKLKRVKLCTQRMKIYHKTRFKDDLKGDMHIFVKTLIDMYSIQCRRTDFVGTIKMLLEKQSGVPQKQHRLIYAGKQLQDYYLLDDLNIQKECTLHLVLKYNDDHKSNAEDEMYSKLLAMDFGRIASRNAAKLFPDDLNSAITAAVSQIDSDPDAVNVNDVQRNNVEQEVEKKEDLLSPQKYVQRQFYEFLKEINLEKYFDKFKENECADMESIRYFDNDILKDDIGIKSSIARKKFMGKCTDIIREMNSFKDEYGLSSVLYKKLIRYGIVTMDILCLAVGSKEDLKNVYQIEDEDDINILCKLMKQNRKNQNYQIEGK